MVLALAIKERITYTAHSVQRDVVQLVPHRNHRRDGRLVRQSPSEYMDE